MARPVTKQELLTKANEQFAKMWALIETISEKDRQAVFHFGNDFNQKESHWDRDQNLRDVFVHLYEWHVLLLEWVYANQNGEARPFLPEPYTWKTYPDMNRVLWEKHQSTPYEEAREKLLETHEKVLALIDRFSQEELFEKKHFNWTGTTNLGSYCISTTSSHYDWAIKKIKAHIKTLHD